MTNKMRYNWKEQREPSAFLAIEDGTVYPAVSVGAARDTVGEVVFNTGMTGYQEILSDPSYSGQFVTMTYPEIGNTGINTDDMESRQFFANGFILHSLNDASNWRSNRSLRESLEQSGVPALSGIDTRLLTCKIRNDGTLKAFMCATGSLTHEDAIQRARNWEGLDDQDYAARVTCETAYEWTCEDTSATVFGAPRELPPIDMHVVAYDFGVKWNILRSMRYSGMTVTVVPAHTSADDVLALKPDGVFLSNGPADPLAVSYAIDAAADLLGKTPMMGICLGHQILGLANGGQRIRLKFGHHGCNHPVMDLSTGKVEITSQNHNFAIDQNSINASKVEITHTNLNDHTVEGLAHKHEPMFCVQYHPEACPGQ
ncbi:MAG: glutamine-hydrolyzing carbamoyl-phosphate synthase small subunit, partial [Verrucomicrobia bacterium]|nr:glutamine-hydrolyzing carbamoyl-phosphate synthase small subunit [Verrucomicrobiota bacterium]